VKLPLERALEATSARLLDERGNAPAELLLNTDTRTLRPGETFLALRGERYDGHAYTGHAAARGAAMLVIDREGARVAGIPAMLVESTLAAYMALAGLARALFAGRVIAITGSAGKTTTRVFLEQLLRLRYGDRVLAPPANENNEIGVSKLLLRATNALHEVIVVEMGARHYGDIAALVAIAQPEAGLLTNVGEAHLEIMGSRERLEETKWALFGGGARAVLNAADETSVRRAPGLTQPVHWFDVARGNERPGERMTVLTPDRLIEICNGISEEHPVDVRVPGRHNRANLAAAIAGAVELDVPPGDLVAAIPSLRLPEGRFERIQTGAGIRIIYDAYNANPSGMLAALQAFGQEPAARRIAVLGSMAELGPESERLHEYVGERAAQSLDVLLVAGEFADALARGARRAGLSSQQLVSVTTNPAAARWLREHVSRDDLVLIKGSRKYRLEEIVTELQS
jgi:UDP-N-acetylmuramoyl-tripeptide--D-alanyl-D-alanine ligase